MTVDWKNFLTEVCGDENFEIWSPKFRDLGSCFQKLCLQIPVLFILATISAFYVGRNFGFVARGSVQKNTIRLRCIITLGLGILPLVQNYTLYSITGVPLTPIEIFLAITETITWLTHFLYLTALIKRLGLSPRGPTKIGVLYTLYFVLTVINFHSNFLIFNSYNNDYNFHIEFSFYMSILRLCLNIFYVFTLIPSEGGSERLIFNTQYVQIGEREPLLSSQSSAFSRFLEEQDPFYLGVALEEATFFSKILFYWVNPLISKGSEKKLKNTDDLYDLPLSLSAPTVSLKVEKALNGNIDKEIRRNLEENRSEVSFSEVKNPKISLFRALHKCFWIQFYSIGFLRLISDLSGFCGPLLLNKLVSFIENKEQEMQYGYLYAFGLFVATLIGALCNAHFNFYMNLVGLKIKAALITTIYRKTLTVESTKLNSEFSFGEIVNFMSTDTDRIVNSCPSFHSLWGIPFQLFFTLYLLYNQVGLAFLAGVTFSVLLIPINKFIASKIGKLSSKLMEKKDERVKLLTEILRGIRTIKLNVWETHFIRLITRVRSEELKYLKGRKYLDALCVFFWATTPVLISILTFGTYTFMGNKLTAATVFTTMALMNMLIAPLNAFPWILNGLTEAWVSIKRVQRLLDLPDLDLEKFYDNSILQNGISYHLVLKKANFDWGPTKNPPKIPIKIDRKGKKPINTSDTVSTTQTQHQIFNLTDITLYVKRGQFIGVMGQVGSGKTSLLSSILADLNKIDGQIALDDLDLGFGFVTQQPWLQRGTIRENILFGKPFDDSKYKKVLHACGLAEDIHLLPKGDLTGVGEGGVTLSGGQKTRVALARAVYADKSLYIMDDIISAVDRNVARHIFQNCLLGTLSNRTRILCTHHTQFLVHCDWLVVLENGKIIKQGKPSEVLDDFEEFLYPSEFEVSDSYENPLLGSDKSENGESGDILDNNELSEEGNVKFDVYLTYWRSIGHFLAVSIFFALILMQSSRNLTDFWLSYWVTSEGNGTNPENQHVTKIALWLPTFHFESSVAYYMTIYGILVGANSFFTLLRAFLFAYGGIKAATKIHRSLLKVVVKSKVTFFDISPLGRILNRFSSDTYTIDDTLPFILNILLAQIFGVIGALVVTIYGLPWVCLVLLPLVPIYHWLQSNYRKTSRELKRLSSVTLSPVYSHFNETLQGLATIRAFRANQRFKRENEDLIEANQKAQFASFSAAQWLGLRLQLIGVATVTAVALLAVIQHQYDFADPGLVGLAISYALGITSLLSGVVNAFTETEREMIATERVNQYIREVEPETDSAIVNPPYAWPSQGVVCFNDVVMKYREHLTPSLKGISFETRPAEKIGIVGRTGGGKSSLFAALFRMVPLHSGKITIDAVNVSHISLNCLRSRISIIPQDPFLFSGTVRENLDPLTEHRDSEIWNAITRVNLVNPIKTYGGLGAKIGTNGLVLSAGQKQLLCLARAILQNAKIICIDEATANVDQETDRQIQQILHSAFTKSTMLTIAHRINTVIDYDRVLVMGEGQILEFDSPGELLNNPDSYFYKLVNNQT